MRLRPEAPPRIPTGARGSGSSTGIRRFAVVGTVARARTKLGYTRSATPRATKRPTMRDIGWAAGFLEGEGSFQRVKSESVRASQLQREPLNRLQQMFGGTIGSHKWYSNRRGPVSGFFWSCHGSRARGIMMTLYALMSPRRQEQIREALDSGPRQD